MFRRSNGTFYILNSSTNYTTSSAISWGATGDIPVPGDYDGNRFADPAVFRPSDGFGNGIFYILHSRTNYTTWSAIPWGVSGDIPLP